MTNKAKAWAIDFVLLAAIWGSSFLFTRIGVVEFGAVATAGVRVAIATAFLLPLLLLRGHGAALRQHWRKTMLIGVLNSGIPFVCFAFSLLVISTGLSAILNATVPLFGALVAWVWLKDRPNRSRLSGLAIGFAGVAMLAWDTIGFRPDAGIQHPTIVWGQSLLAERSGGLSRKVSGFASGWAVLACLLATLCYGIAASLTKKFLGGLPALVTATGSQMGASIFLLLPTLCLWPAQMPSAHAWGALLAVGVLCTGLAYILYFRLIESVGPAKALAVTFAVPVFAVFYGVLLLGESVTAWMLLCAAVIVCGTSLSTGLVALGRRSAT